MRMFPMALAMMLATLALAPPASGQTLAERLEAVQRKREKQRREDPRMALLQTLLYGTLTVDFDRIPARDAIEFVKVSLGFNLVGRYRDDAPGHGIDPETPITLALEEAPALQVLEQILEQCSVQERCTWQLRRGFIEVGTRERLGGAAARELRIYNVEALLFEPAYFDDAPANGIEYGPFNDPYWGDPYRTYPGGGAGFSGSVTVAGSGAGVGTGADPGRTDRGRELAELIVETIEPDAWERNGGDWASIRYRDGILIVRAPDFVHRQINGYPRVPPPRKAKPRPKAVAP